MFMSNRIGARIWEGLRDRETVELIAASISRQNGVPYGLVKSETAEFVAELETQGFLSRGIEN
jgi:hypothetical protein